MMKRTLFGPNGLVRSMVLQDQNDSPEVPRFLLSTSVLRIWASQPIGRKDRECESLSVKRTALRVVDTARLSCGWEIFATGPNGLLWR
jgi:hypothetical protein